MLIRGSPHEGVTTPGHKILHSLGRLDRLSPEKLDPLINGLNRAVGRLENTAHDISHDPARTYGTVFALHELWKDLGFDRALNRALRSPEKLDLFDILNLPKPA